MISNFADVAIVLMGIIAFALIIKGISSVYADPMEKTNPGDYLLLTAAMVLASTCWFVLTLYAVAHSPLLLGGLDGFALLSVQIVRLISLAIIFIYAMARKWKLSAVVCGLFFVVNVLSLILTN